MKNHLEIKTPDVKKEAGVIVLCVSITDGLMSTGSSWCPRSVQPCPRFVCQLLPSVCLLASNSNWFDQF